MSFLDPIFNPLLSIDPLWAILIISFIISLIITIIYKYTTNQSLMKQLKDEMKDLQKQSKENRDNPEKMMRLQKELMQLNMKYMMQSMKSTLITFIPIILIFGWMSANLAYEPIHPNQEFSVTLNFNEGSLGEVSLVAPPQIKIRGESTMKVEENKAIFLLSSEKEGEYLLEFDYNNEKHRTNAIISNKQSYAPVLTKVKESNLKTIEINNKPIKILNLFGWKIGWIGTYIIFSIVFSLGMRKLFKLY